eukprot:1158855-Pelagomonas_calceolata.AAC.8
MQGKANVVYPGPASPAAQPPASGLWCACLAGHMPGCMPYGGNIFLCVDAWEHTLRNGRVCSHVYTHLVFTSVLVLLSCLHLPDVQPCAQQQLPHAFCFLPWFSPSYCCFLAPL